ncbi:unnamed protein product [Orchesella dallaii]|uniref:Uncharacterized protein n=1 Tax=Orchesella dallaii TaxID=48710 RepID=A0ABP1R6H2_9HEXA
MSGNRGPDTQEVRRGVRSDSGSTGVLRDESCGLGVHCDVPGDWDSMWQVVHSEKKDELVQDSDHVDVQKQSTGSSGYAKSHHWVCYKMDDVVHEQKASDFRFTITFRDDVLCWLNNGVATRRHK